MELIKIINYLKEAGAEAIEINGQRIVAKTDIVNITETYIRANSQPISSPYEIKAIGDPDYLKSNLIATGYVNQIKNWGQSITFEEPKKVTINKYNGSYDTKYGK